MKAPRDIARLEADNAWLNKAVGRLEEEIWHLREQLRVLTEPAPEVTRWQAECRLTRSEAVVLTQLLRFRGDPVRRETLHAALDQQVRDHTAETAIKVIDVHISRIRRKVEGRVTIRNIHNVGYVAEITRATQGEGASA